MFLFTAGHKQKKHAPRYGARIGSSVTLVALGTGFEPRDLRVRALADGVVNIEKRGFMWVYIGWNVA